MPSGVCLNALTPFPLDRVPPALTGGVVAVGNFDGMHGGHRALLAAARVEADDRGVPAVALTFEPHPRTVLTGTPVFRLTPLSAKALLLRALQIDGLVVGTFDHPFAALSADTFVEEVLLGRLKVAAAVVGFDFHFGKGGAGSPAFLVEIGRQKGFPVVVIEQLREPGGAPVSSTAIREDLIRGAIADANRRLGYRWFVVGTVAAGARRGRELGFPTANIELPRDCRLRHGIYAVRLLRADGTLHDGVASYGRRPTFDDGAPLLEVYVFDFDGDLYGEEVMVTFVGWIRPEEKFASVEALVAAIGRDVETSRAMLASAGPGTALDRALQGDAA